jgi:hypothetical protein
MVQCSSNQSLVQLIGFLNTPISNQKMTVVRSEQSVFHPSIVGAHLDFDCGLPPTDKAKNLNGKAPTPQYRKVYVYIKKKKKKKKYMQFE